MTVGCPGPFDVHLGCGTELFRGWVNIDPRHIESDDPDIIVQEGGCTRLPFADGTVRNIFSNAMFEHVFLAQHGEALREWRRVLTGDGMIIAIGIPDFHAIARLYLDGADGITGTRFDLFESYRYVCGFADGHLWEQGYRWDWDAGLTPNEAPDGYLPQVHKAVFDSDYLAGLLDHVGLRGQAFKYAYVGERHALNLGFVAGRADRTVADLGRLSFIGRYVDPDTVEPVTATRPSRMVKILRLLERGR